MVETRSKDIIFPEKESLSEKITNCYPELRVSDVKEKIQNVRRRLKDYLETGGMFIGSEIDRVFEEEFGKELTQSDTNTEAKE